MTHHLMISIAYSVLDISLDLSSFVTAAALIVAALIAHRRVRARSDTCRRPDTGCRRGAADRTKGAPPDG